MKKKNKKILIIMLAIAFAIAGLFFGRVFPGGDPELVRKVKALQEVEEESTDEFYEKLTQEKIEPKEDLDNLAELKEKKAKISARKEKLKKELEAEKLKELKNKMEIKKELIDRLQKNYEELATNYEEIAQQDKEKTKDDDDSFSNMVTASLRLELEKERFNMLKTKYEEKLRKNIKKAAIKK
jgi:predicted phage tail protein